MSWTRAVKGSAALGLLVLVLGSAACPGPEPAVRQTASGGAGGTAGAAGAGGQGGSCDAASCPGVDTDCRLRTCFGDHQCSSANVAELQPCDDAPPDGKVCDGAGNCVECVDNGQCTGPETCDTNTHVCVALHCSNQVLDEDETDLNCGGVDCADCVNGKFCNDATDCRSAYCDTSAGGGQGGSGAAGVCTACSSDNQCGGTEWCDPTLVGGTCAPKKTDGEVCGGPGECTSGFCPTDDGVCCGGACDAECMACLLVKTGQANGSCSSVTQDEDPDAECADQGAGTCGANGTGCNGSATLPGCQLYPDTTVCGTESCSGSLYMPPPECNGSGNCVTGLTTCANNLTCNAGGTACLTTCSVDADCVGGFYCVAPNCVAKQANGASCGSSNECTSGQCADGFCCNNSCNGGCNACDLAGSEGTCTNVGAGQPGEPLCTPYLCGSGASCPTSCSVDGDCISGDYCDASNVCVPKLANAAVCGGDNVCESNHCIDGVCCNNACGGLCTACTAALKGSGSDGTCGAIAAGTDPGDECASGVCDGNTVCVACVTDANCLGTQYCDATNVCQPKKANGGTCTGTNQCTSGNCADGVCCDTACAGSCDVCSSQGTCTILTGGAPGNPSCAPYKCNGGSACSTVCAGDGQCAAGNYCDGSSACVPKLADGVACGGNNQCANGNCVDGVCCNSACNGLCEGCTAALKGFGPNGTCGPIAAGTDPGDECTPGACNLYVCVYCATDANCAGTEYCSPANTCVPRGPYEAPCTSGNQCLSGICLGSPYGCGCSASAECPQQFPTCDSGECIDI